MGRDIRVDDGSRQVLRACSGHNQIYSSRGSSVAGFSGMLRGCPDTSPIRVISVARQGKIRSGGISRLDAPLMCSVEAVGII